MNNIAVGGGIYTHSGIRVDLVNPDPATINLVDIAYALSNICRFTGHTGEFYSVAEHSLRVASILPREYKLVGLLHDAPEAYLGDVSSPLKKLLPDYQKLEANMWSAVAKKWCLPDPVPDIVKQADFDVFRHEWRDVMGTPANLFEGYLLDDIIEPLTSERARQIFIDGFYQCLSYSEGC